MVFCKKRSSYKFWKIHKKGSALKTRFWWNCRYVELNFIKKQIPAQMFSYKLCEISHDTFFKEPFGRLLLHKHSFCLLSHHDLLPFQKRCHISSGLICRLGTGVSSIFQTLKANFHLLIVQRSLAYSSSKRSLAIFDFHCKNIIWS